MTNGYRIKADVSRLGSDSLTLSNGLTLAEQDIQSIELQDSLWEGAAIGPGIGAALLFTQPVGSDSGAAVVGGVAFLLAAPAGVGACVDGFFHRTIYSGTRAVQLFAYGHTGRDRCSTLGGLVKSHRRRLPVTVQARLGRSPFRRRPSRTPPGRADASCNLGRSRVRQEALVRICGGESRTAELLYHHPDAEGRVRRCPEWDRCCCLSSWS